MSLDDGASTKTVKFDTESVIRLQAFLSDFLQKEDDSSDVRAYEPTGRALAVMDGNTLDIIRVFRTSNIIGLAGMESDSYETLCDKVRPFIETEFPSTAMFIFFDTID